MIEPYWERVSIYNGRQIFFREYALTPQVARNLLTAHWCQSEVCNGGLHQFFCNSTGVLAPEAAIGYQAVGMPGLGFVVRRAVEFFGPVFSGEERERQSALDSYALTHSVWDPFEKLNEEFFELLENEGGGWAYAADEYAKRHRP